MTLTQFAAWFAAAVPSCRYCSIPEPLLGELGLRTSIGLGLVRLGSDRVDNSAPYSTSNIVLCCYACNSTKSNVFSEDEMDVLAPAMASVWVTRLADAGITWTPMLYLHEAA